MIISLLFDQNIYICEPTIILLKISVKIYITSIREGVG